MGADVTAAAVLVDLRCQHITNTETRCYPLFPFFSFLFFWKNMCFEAVAYFNMERITRSKARVKVSHSRTPGERETIQIDQMNPFDVDAVGMQLYMFRCSLCGMVAWFGKWQCFLGWYGYCCACLKKIYCSNQRNQHDRVCAISHKVWRATTKR